MEILTLLLHNVFSFIVILSAIVFIHEFGHYWVAKRFGVKIESFSIGFGREIFGWNDKSGTRWKVGWAPLGGYVKMFGDSDAASTPDNSKIKSMNEEERKQAFFYKKLYQRFLIVLAGPAFNFMTAIIILSFFFNIYGRPETKPIIELVMKESAADKIGLKPGDEIIEIAGSKITRFEQIKGIISLNPGIPTKITYKRKDKVVETTITPEIREIKDIFGDVTKVGLIGVSSTIADYKKLPPLSAIRASVEETYDICDKTLMALGQMITGQRSAQDISGILRIADYSGKSVDQGAKMVFWFIAILSINLGLVNLFPIPMLDGGHLFFYLIEGVRGKPLSEKTQEYFFRFGFLILMSLMLFATFNDLRHFNIIKLP